MSSSSPNLLAQRPLGSCLGGMGRRPTDVVDPATDAVSANRSLNDLMVVLDD